MIIHNISTFAPNSCEDTAEAEADIIVIHYEPGVKPEGKTALFLRRFLKWFGFIVTLALGTAVFAPDALRVPAAYRSWIFVIFIFWFFAFCAGFFNQ
jgi:hypothetical protein